MKIEISDQMKWHLQQWCAEQIHGAVMTMHLRVVATPEERAEFPDAFAPRHRDDLAEIRTLIRSLPDKWARQDFVIGQRYRFQALRTEHGTEPRWQNYAASVARYRATLAAERRAA